MTCRVLVVVVIIVVVIVVVGGKKSVGKIYYSTNIIDSTMKLTIIGSIAIKNNIFDPNYNKLSTISNILLFISEYNIDIAIYYIAIYCNILLL